MLNIKEILEFRKTNPEPKEVTKIRNEIKLCNKIKVKVPEIKEQLKDFNKKENEEKHKKVQKKKERKYER